MLRNEIGIIQNKYIELYYFKVNSVYLFLLAFMDVL